MPFQRKVLLLLIPLVLAIALLSSHSVGASRAKADATISGSVVSGAYLYGIDDANDIYEINPVSQTYTMINGSIDLPGFSNALAYDADNRRLYFTNKNTKTVQVWDMSNSSGDPEEWASWSEAGIPNSGIANATWSPGENGAPGSYTFATKGKKPELCKATKPGSSSSVTSECRPFSSTADLGGYGDIALAIYGNVIYGATTKSKFYELTELDSQNNPDVQVKGTTTANGGANRTCQLAFDFRANTSNADDSVLYCQAHGNDISGGSGELAGAWYTVNIVSGELTPILEPGGGQFTTATSGSCPGNQSCGMRDIAGVAYAPYQATCEIDVPSGNGVQSSLIDTAVADPPRVRVTVNGDPQPGIEVTFEVVSTGSGVVGGGSLNGQSSVTAVTDNNGVAATDGWVLSATPGTNQVKATTPYLTCNVIFDAVGFDSESPTPVSPSPEPSGPSSPDNPSSSKSDQLVPDNKNVSDPGVGPDRSKGVKKLRPVRKLNSRCLWSTRSSVKVKWRAPSDTDAVTGYESRYRTKGGEWSRWKPSADITPNRDGLLSVRKKVRQKKANRSRSLVVTVQIRVVSDDSFGPRRSVQTRTKPCGVRTVKGFG